MSDLPVHPVSAEAVDKAYHELVDSALKVEALAKNSDSEAARGANSCWELVKDDVETAFIAARQLPGLISTNTTRPPNVSETIQASNNANKEFLAAISEATDAVEQIRDGNEHDPNVMKTSLDNALRAGQPLVGFMETMRSQLNSMTSVNEALRDATQATKDISAQDAEIRDLEKELIETLARAQEIQGDLGIRRAARAALQRENERLIQEAIDTLLLLQGNASNQN